MKVVAMLGGLGSQMFKYAFFYSLKRQTTQNCLIDTAPFDIVKMWNGYELKKIFGIEEDDIKNLFNEKEKNKLKECIYNDREVVLSCMDRLEGPVKFYNRGIPVRFRNKNLLQEYIYRFNCLLVYRRINRGDCDCYPDNYIKEQESAYFDEFDHRSDKYFCEYHKDIKKIFRFPPFKDERNLVISRQMEQEESVALHVRRGDHMYDNGGLFERGYYKKAVSHIKENANGKQTFYLFSDDLEWCLSNLDTLGLSNGDEVIPIDWNVAEESYRDMQLMTFCQHNIIPISSFSWWGYYLSDREDKIVCAPEGYWLEVENHF